MVFGNTSNIRELMASRTQTRIYAMRPSRAIPAAEITRRTHLTLDEVRRYNPALLTQVPAHGTLYLPMYMEEFGPDVSFWHTPPGAAYASVLSDFLRIDATLEQWDDPAFAPVLRGFQTRFAQTNTEEGTVFATVLAYVIDDAYASRRGAILAEFRNSDKIQHLFERAVLDWNATRRTQAAAPVVRTSQN